MTTVTREGDKVVIRPAGGDIVAASVQELRSAMRGVVQEGIRELVVDLTEVQMVDSSGIGLLISAYNSLRKTGGRLAVIHASAEILELFKTMRMHQHFSNMLEVAFLAAHLLWMMTRQDVAALYDMITIEPAKAINLDGFGLSVGAPANLVVLDQPEEVEALRYHGPPAHVISHGKRLDAAKMRAIVAAGAGAA